MSERRVRRRWRHHRVRCSYCFQSVEHATLGSIVDYDVASLETVSSRALGNRLLGSADRGWFFETLAKAQHSVVDEPRVDREQCAVGVERITHELPGRMERESVPLTVCSPLDRRVDWPKTTASDTTVSAVLAPGCRTHTTVSAVLGVNKETAVYRWIHPLHFVRCSRLQTTPIGLRSPN